MTVTKTRNATTTRKAIVCRCPACEFTLAPVNAETNGKYIERCRVIGDFGAYHNGTLLAFYPHYLAAEEALNELVYALLSRADVERNQCKTCGALRTDGVCGGCVYLAQVAQAEAAFEMACGDEDGTPAEWAAAVVAYEVALEAADALGHASVLYQQSVALGERLYQKNPYAFSPTTRMIACFASRIASRTEPIAVRRRCECFRVIAVPSVWTATTP